MDVVEKRKIGELIAMYEFEPELRDIYVEGISDKLVIERFLLKNGISNFKVVEIDHIDFSEIYDEYPEIKRNNKRKVITLSQLLTNNIDETLECVSCVVDQDFDQFLNLLISNEYLRYTDYTGLEMYLFNKETLDIFYKTVLRGFPFTANKTLKALGQVLKDKYLIRLAVEIKDEIQDEKTITDLKKSAKPNKTNGVIDFSYKEHLLKILVNNKIGSKNNEYIECIEIEREKCCNDLRNHIRGHDFVHLLFIYINKIKNNIELSEDLLERSLFQCIDYSELNKYQMFSYLKTKYS